MLSRRASSETSSDEQQRQEPHAGHDAGLARHGRRGLPVHHQRQDTRHAKAPERAPAQRAMAPDRSPCRQASGLDVHGQIRLDILPRLPVPTGAAVRELGFYWVRRECWSGEPEVAHWDGNEWFQCGDDRGAYDDSEPPVEVLSERLTLKAFPFTRPGAATGRSRAPKAPR